MTSAETIALLCEASEALRAGDDEARELSTRIDATVAGMNALKALADSEPLLKPAAPTDFYHSAQDKYFLYYEEGGKWFKVQATNFGAGWGIMDRFDTRPDIGLEPVAPWLNRLCRAPERFKVGRLADQIANDLTPADLEILLFDLVRIRNNSTRDRKRLIKELRLHRKHVSRRLIEDWEINYPPDRTPAQEVEDGIKAQQAEAEARERAEARIHKEKGRELRRMEPNADGMVQCALTDGRFVAPFYEGHARNKNWGALIKQGDRAAWLSSPRNEDGPKTYAVTAKNYTLAAGSLIEFSADYFSIADEQVRTRAFYVVVAVDEIHITLISLAADEMDAAVAEAKQRLESLRGRNAETVDPFDD